MYNIAVVSFTWHCLIYQEKYGLSGKMSSLDVNSFLKPLLMFWKGELLNESESKAPYKFALCCISSDLPATRKCCGFVSYNLTMLIEVSKNF